MEWTNGKAKGAGYFINIQFKLQFTLFNNLPLPELLKGDSVGETLTANTDAFQYAVASARGENGSFFE